MNESDDKLKIVLSLTVLLGTLLYSTYNFIQTTPLNALYYSFTTDLVLIGILLLMCFTLYLALLALSLEIKTEYKVSMIENFASHIYRFSIILFVVFVIGYCFVYLQQYFLEPNTLFGYVFYIFSLFLTGFIFLGLPVLILGFLYDIHVWDIICKKEKVDIKTLFFITLITVSVLVAISASVEGTNVIKTADIMNGDLNFDIGDVYYIDKEPIYFSVQITGQNTPLSVKINQTNSNNTESIIDDSKGEYHYFGEYLYVNEAKTGMYEIFIHKNNFTTGFYTISLQRLNDDNVYQKTVYMLAKDDDKNKKNLISNFNSSSQESQK